MESMTSNSTFYTVTVLFKRPGITVNSGLDADEFFRTEITRIEPHGWGIEIHDAHDSYVCWWPWREIMSVKIESTYS